MIVDSADDPDKVANALEEIRPRLEEHALLFEICKTAMALPAYFSFKYALVREERPPRAVKAQGKVAPKKSKDQKQSGLVFRTISALRIERKEGTGSTRAFTAPQYRVEVSGYWRRLEDDAVGHDAEGNPIAGKTWVRAHAKWKDKPAKPIEVLVKQRLAPAKAFVEKNDKASGA